MTSKGGQLAQRHSYLLLSFSDRARPRWSTDCRGFSLFCGQQAERRRGGSGTQERSAARLGGWIGENRQPAAIQRGSACARVEPVAIQHNSLRSAAQSRAIQRGKGSGAGQQGPIPRVGRASLRRTPRPNEARRAEPRSNPRSDGPVGARAARRGAIRQRGRRGNCGLGGTPTVGSTQTAPRRRSPRVGSQNSAPKAALSNLEAARDASFCRVGGLEGTLSAR